MRHGTRWCGCFIPACGGGGRLMRRRHTTGEGREREGRGGESRPTGGRRPASVAQPCHAAGSIGEREGADRWAQTHSVGRLHRLTGGPGRIVPGLNKFQNNPYLIQTHPNLLQSKEDIRLLQNFEIKYGWKVFEIRNNFP
jgi:hypothetical protein